MKILSVSFPRSGCMFLRDCMQSALGNRLRWADSHREKVNSYHNFIKTHDFDLKAELPEDHFLLVMYRDPMEAIPSWFDLEVRNGRFADNEEGWEHFLRDVLPYHSEWKQKWLGKGLCVNHSMLKENIGNIVDLLSEVLGTEKVNDFTKTVETHRLHKLSLQQGLNPLMKTFAT